MTNCKLAIYTMQYNPAVRKDMVSDTPTFSHIPAFYAVVSPTIESEIVDAKERSRTVREKFVVTLTKAQKQKLEGGYIQITHLRNPDTNTWDCNEVTTQYVAQTVTQTNMVGREYTVSVLRRDEVE